MSPGFPVLTAGFGLVGPGPVGVLVTDGPPGAVGGGWDPLCPHALSARQATATDAAIRIFLIPV
jgi:hypothetical protein